MVGGNAARARAATATADEATAMDSRRGREASAAASNPGLQRRQAVQATAAGRITLLTVDIIAGTRFHEVLALARLPLKPRFIDICLQLCERM